MSVVRPARDEGLQRPIERVVDEQQVVRELLQLDGRRILELGCGRAAHTRAIARGGPGREVVALEVDEVQHRANLAIDDLPGVRFGLGGAQRIPEPDTTFDCVFLFKSLHHVPVSDMDAALDEVARVLRPSGHAYVSEPLYRDAYNDVLRIFHDEAEVRREAHLAIDRALQRGVLELVSQTFFRADVHFPDFAAFERSVIRATHSEHRLDDEQWARTRAAFAAHVGADGARFEQPIRVDLLRRPR
ncbi:MAG: class I SAM-dependent methyltransferase [Planctomycetota bacterium]